MKALHRRKKNTGSSETPTPRSHRYGIRSEWPLLIYPALFLMTLVLLYAVNRSIESDLATPSTEGHAPHGTTTTSGDSGHGSSTTVVEGGRQGLPSDSMIPSHQSGQAPQTPPDRPPQSDRTVDSAGRTALVADRTTQPMNFDHLPAPQRMLALLQVAIAENNHARIKECLRELVAMGDAAVVPLNDLVLNADDETSLWAAEALARIGTPMATSALLDTLSQTKEGPYKEELGKRISIISNHDSWPLLLDSVVLTGDPVVVRAAAASLSRMADTPIVDEIVGRYDAATTEAELERLSQLMSNIQSPGATEALLSLAGRVSSTPQDSLQQAAVDALAKIGDSQCVSHLLQRLEATPPGQESQIFNAVTRIKSPEAQASLLYAAAGNKEVSAAYGRSAAIQALKNYPNEQTVALLEQIVAQEDNERVLAAATRTLDEIRRAPHAVTAKADPLLKSDDLLPGTPRTK